MTTLYRDRYEPLALAGRGAQGEVWMARDQVHDRFVALKIRQTASVDRDLLLGEARTLLGMRPHEHLPLVRDDFFVDDRYVIVMDWIEGRSLETSPPTSFDAVLGHLAAVARALDHLHAHDPPIIHRDVKPQNIVITPVGRTVLVDFGLAGGTGPTYLEGTPIYVAPEVVAGETATPASDVYSLAVTAFVTLTGELPMPGRDPKWGRVPEASHDRVRRVLAEGMSIDPHLRPSTAGALIASLRPPSAPSNLPAALSSFVGRESDTAEVTRALNTSRLVTLSGPGGSGKTRLALHVADRVLPVYPEGVWLAELAGVTDGDLIASRVALALGSQPAGDALDAVIDALAHGSQLLVLDNCEHVIDACAHVVDALLRACPRLAILATSREPLRVTGERVWRVQPLDADESLELFIARTPLGVRLTDDDLRLADEICRRLDGIPLAIELAAAQLGSLELREIAAALNEALGVLTGGARTNPRQETMQATIDWSYNLLGPQAQAALARLSVFAGGFTSDAGAEVCEAGAVLDELVRSSLLTSDGERYRMLETVRQYARAKLDEIGGADAIRARHARWIADLTEARPASAAEHLERLTDEHDNIDAAMSFAVADDHAMAARIATAAIGYWMRRDWNTGRRWIGCTLENAGGLDDHTRAMLHLRAGDLARAQGELRAAKTYVERAVKLFRETGDPRWLARALSTLGGVDHELGDFASTRRHFDESIGLHRQTGDGKGLAIALSNMSVLHSTLGETREAIYALEEAIERLRAVGRDDPDADVLGRSLLNLGVLYGQDWTAVRRAYDEALETFTSMRNDHGRSEALLALAEVDRHDGLINVARARAEEALEIARQLGDKSGMAEAIQFLGDLHRPDDLDGAIEHHLAAIALHREVGSPRATAFSLTRAAFVDVQRGDAVAAAHHFGEAEALYEASGMTPFPDAEMDDDLAWMKATLGDERFDREWEAGRRAVDART